MQWSQLLRVHPFMCYCDNICANKHGKGNNITGKLLSDHWCPSHFVFLFLIHVLILLFVRSSTLQLLVLCHKGHYGTQSLCGVPNAVCQRHMAKVGLHTAKPLSCVTHGKDLTANQALAKCLFAVYFFSSTRQSFCRVSEQHSVIWIFLNLWFQIR